MTATNAAEEIKQKAKRACQEDMKKAWIEKPLKGDIRKRKTMVM